MKHTKRIFAMVFALILLFSYSALAQEAQSGETQSSISDIKITVGYDSIFYKAKLFFERVRLTNAFTQAGKANVSAIFAKRRMAEAGLMAEKKDFDAAQDLMIDGVGLMSQATDYSVQAIMHKDNNRSRLVLSNISDAQAMMIDFLNRIDNDFPDTFDTAQMATDINEDIVDIIVMWTYLEYKESILNDELIRENAMKALQNAFDSDGSISLDAISSATQLVIEETGELLDEADAETAATYDGTALDAGAQQGTDATSSASTTNTEGTQGTLPGVDGTSSATEPAPSDGQTTDPSVDATSSATTLTGTEPAPSGTGGVDATSSATTPGTSGTSQTGTSLYYDDDDEYEEHEEHDDDDHEREHDDDDHEEHDDD